jgi:hypothetical protein
MNTEPTATIIKLNTTSKPSTRQPIGQAQLNIALQTLCTELTTAINESTQVARTAAITINKPRSTLPDAFSGKCNATFRPHDLIGFGNVMHNSLSCNKSISLSISFLY